MKSSERERVFERFVRCWSEVSSWTRFAKFVMKNGEIGRARDCYEIGVDNLAEDDEETEALFVAFAEFEEECKEVKRARGIYGLDHRVKKGQGENLV